MFHIRGRELIAGWSRTAGQAGLFDLKGCMIRSAFCLTLLFFQMLSPVVLSAEPSLAIPGTPKGDLPTELLQSRMYARGIEWKLNKLEKAFPSLAVEVYAARASWLSSPFASGCDAIEADIINKAPEQGKAVLAQLDAASWKELAKYDDIATVKTAREFLKLVDSRAKGAIEVDLVRGNLLWNHPAYAKSPEKEFSDGFTRRIQHTANSGMEVTFEVPMSWKAEASPKKELVGFRNGYGHGNVWMTVLINPTVDENGVPVRADELHARYTEDMLRQSYEVLGIELTSFLKTKVNGMPAFMFTRRQPYEQLGEKALRAAEVIRVFRGRHMINFQINTFGPEEGTVGEDRIKKYQALFKMIGGSLRVQD
jgi:hypothetical protein